ncbi:uncharacterized protein LOC117181901 [Belonocnema kinseyi]|uniref:uncharacterized protein LOC117181901 n=1 Tax=Belonocnema kinseyi TaxID=2817044 RepID=UPI00143D56C2|nr:uncharacterized protein LOC117181901 [Belonocnema kinseyi]
MLNIEVPAQFVLTLQSVPPFVFESLFALALVLLLSVPLFNHIFFLFDDPGRKSSKASLSRNVSFSTIKKRTIVMHYPVPLVKSTSSSSLSVTLTPVRNTISSPIPKSPPSKKNNFEDPLPLNQSKSFVATNSELPVVDISSVNYLSYIHKLIEILLKKQCNDQPPPGDLVLNSIFINATDSKTEKKLKEDPGRNSLNVQEDPEPVKVIKKWVWDYLHPLDHFLVKGIRKPETSEKGTDTKESISENDVVPELVNFKGPPASPKKQLNFYSRKRSNNAQAKSKSISGNDVVPEIVDSMRLPPSPKRQTFYSQKRNCNSATNSQFNSGNVSQRQTNDNENSRIEDINKNEIPHNEAEQPLRRSDEPKVDVKLDSDSPESQSPQFPRKTPRTPKRQRSTGSLQKLKKSEKSNQCMIIDKIKNPQVEVFNQNIYLLKREHRNDHSQSSSEVGSESSKFKDSSSYRAKSLLMKKKSRGNTPLCSNPWFTGSCTQSFNRRCPNARPRSTGGRSYFEKRTVSVKNWCSNPSSASESRCTTPRLATPRKRSTSPQRNDIISNKEDKENKADKNRHNSEEANPKNSGQKSSEGTSEIKSRDLKSVVLKSKIVRSTGMKSSKPKALVLNSSELKSSEVPKSPDTKSRPKSSGGKSSIPTPIPYSQTFLVSSKSPPSSSRYSESHLPLQMKNHLTKNKLNSDSVLVGKKTASESGSKSLERPKSSRISKLQRAKTVGSILCKNSISGVMREKREGDNVVVNRDAEIVRSPDIEVVNENLPSVKRRASDKGYEVVDRNSTTVKRRDSERARSLSAQSEESWLDEQSTAQMTKWSSSNSLHDSGVSRTKTFSTATVQISKRISQDRKSIDSRWSRPRIKSSSGSKTNSLLLRTDEISEINLDQENKEPKLPKRDSKVGIAIQQGLKSYIHKVKKTLSERENFLIDSEELASMSLTDAILPDIRTDLNRNEVQQVQQILTQVEKFDCKKTDVQKHV